ncbi:MAG: VOC family protein [Jatrophihabitans sp.]
MIRWAWAVIGRPPDQLASGAAFWTAVTDTRLSDTRLSAVVGTDRTALLLPPVGDACLKLQDSGTRCDAHLDLAVDELAAATDRAIEFGAELVEFGAGRASLRSPAGQRFCLQRWRGESERPGVVRPADQPASRLDQLCIDVASTDYDAELAFWRSLTGWEFHRGSSPDRDLLKPPPNLPVRILVQRLGSARPASGHLDLACSDIEATMRWHQALGARLVGRWSRWIVMQDPAGGAYCLTRRDPQTGALPLALRGLS